MRAKGARCAVISSGPAAASFRQLCESRANQRQRLDPGGRLGPNERRQRFRPFRDQPDVPRDRRNCEVERHHQNQQQHDGQQRDGEAAPTAKPRLRIQQERPRGNRDRCRPDQRDQEWPHDPEARADQGGQGKQLEGGTREIRRSIRIHFLTSPKSTRHGLGFGSLASAMRIAISAAVRKSRRGMVISPHTPLDAVRFRTTRASATEWAKATPIGPVLEAIDFSR